MTLEEQYKHETGETPIYEGVHIYGAADGEYTKSYVKWLETHLTLALSHIEEAEALRMACRTCKTNEL